MNLLQLPATSAPTERSFSTHGKVHSKSRNRTKTQRAAKLAYVAFNLKISLRNPKKKKKSHVNVGSQNVVGIITDSVEDDSDCSDFNEYGSDFGEYESDADEDGSDSDVDEYDV